MTRTPERTAVRLLALASVALAAMCLMLAAAWRREADAAACYRQALNDGETPAVADADCRE